LTGRIDARIEAETEVDAPVAAGTRLGRVVFTSGDSVVRRIDLVAAEDVPQGNLLIRMRDAIIRFFRRVFVRG
jgi:D-alanyl-D-alanine carboxypeptidase (penicillin-binding protein 5/6)